MINFDFDCAVSKSALLLSIEVLDASRILPPALLHEKRFKVAYDASSDIAHIPFVENSLIVTMIRHEWYDKYFDIRLVFCFNLSKTLVGIESARILSVWQTGSVTSWNLPQLAG